MTSDAGQEVNPPDPAASRNGEVRVVTCYVIDFADCGDDVWDDSDGVGKPHFDSESELRRWLVEHAEWTFAKHSRALCSRCTARADCASNGHRYSEWTTLHTDPGVQWRWCEHCNDALEERLTAMVEGRD